MGWRISDLTSYLYSFLSPITYFPGARSVQTPPVREDDSSAARDRQLATENYHQINMAFTSLVTHTFDYLHRQPGIIDKLMVFLATHYQFKTFVTSARIASMTLRDLFIEISTQGMWSYLNYRLLSDIIEEFSGDNHDLPKELYKYKQDLIGFKLATKLETYISTIQPEMEAMERSEYLPRPNPDPLLFKRLSVKFDLDITELSLEYVDRLWNTLGRHIRSPLLLLLDKVSRNCLRINWRIPSELASHVVEMLQQCSNTLKDRCGVLTITMDNENIFCDEVS